MKRLTATALATLLGLAGCANVGLDGNVPLEEAAHRTPAELVAAVHPPPTADDDGLVMAGRLWVPWGTPTSPPDGALRPVGSAHGVTVRARSWDREPYDALFVRHGGAWQGYAPVTGRSSGAAGH